MNNLITIDIDGIIFQHDSKEGFIRSDAVAVILGYDHHSLTRVLRRHFTDTVSINSNNGLGRPEKIYLLAERDVMMLPAYLEPNERVKAWQGKIVDGFLKLREILADLTKSQVPGSLKDALRLAADEIEKRELVEAKVKELEPLAQIADQLCNSDGNYYFRDASKVMGITQGELIEFLKVNRYIFRSIESRWEPYGIYVTQGIFITKSKPFEKANGDKEISKTCFITPKGLVYIQGKLNIDKALKEIQ